MGRAWLCDLEKAIIAVRDKVSSLFMSVNVNIYGDFIFQIDVDNQVVVKHNDFSVWRNFGDWRNPDWRELK